MGVATFCKASADAGERQELCWQPSQHTPLLLQCNGSRTWAVLYTESDAAIGRDESMQSAERNDTMLRRNLLGNRYSFWQLAKPPA